MKFQRFICSILILYTTLKAATFVTGSSTPTPPSGPTISTPTPINLREDVTSEKDLATISCLDNSEGVAPGTRCLSCNIFNITPEFGGFEVWKKNGNLDFHLYYFPSPVNSQLNYTAVRSYTVNTYCHGNNLVNSTWTIEIDIQPNLAPVFSVYPTDAKSVPAGSTAENTVIYTPTVTDAENDTVTFTSEINPTTDLFTVNPGNGEVSTLVDLRTATTSSFVVTMSASDGRRTTGPFTLTITLTDLNRAPSCTDFPASVDVREDAPSGHFILTLTCTDPDEPGVFLTPDMTVDPFIESSKFDFNGRVLRLNPTHSGSSLLNAEAQLSYRICFRLTDGFLEVNNLCVTINVININEDPRCSSNSYSCIVDETTVTSPTSTCTISNFNIIDPDGEVFTQMTITIIPSAVSGLFSWNTQTRSLTLSRIYDIDDRSRLTSLNLELLVLDSGNASTTCTVTVTINDVNDNDPRVTGDLIYVISPDSPPVPSTLGALTVTDNDLSTFNSGVNLRVRSTFPGIGSSYVSLDQHDLQYRRRADSFIIGQTMRMEIEAVDTGLPPRSSTVTVYINVVAETVTTTTPTTTQTTVAGGSQTTTQAAQGGGTSGGSNQDGGLLSSDVGVVLVAAVVAIAAVLVLTGGFFLYRYLTTGSCPVGVSNGQSSGSNSKYGQSNMRVSPHNVAEYNPSQYYGQQRYPGY